MSRASVAAAGEAGDSGPVDADLVEKVPELLLVCVEAGDGDGALTSCAPTSSRRLRVTRRWMARVARTVSVVMVRRLRLMRSSRPWWRARYT